MVPLVLTHTHMREQLANSGLRRRLPMRTQAGRTCGSAASGFSQTRLLCFSSRRNALPEYSRPARAFKRHSELRMGAPRGCGRSWTASAGGQAGRGCRGCRELHRAPCLSPGWLFWASALFLSWPAKLAEAPREPTKATRRLGYKPMHQQVIRLVFRVPSRTCRSKSVRCGFAELRTGAFGFVSEAHGNAPASEASPAV